MSDRNEHGHVLQYEDDSGLWVINPDSNPLFPSYVLKEAKKPAKKSRKAKKE